MNNINIFTVIFDQINIFTVIFDQFNVKNKTIFLYKK